MSVSTIISEAGYQLTGGILIGVLVDNMFPAAHKVDSSNALRVLGEVVLEIGIDAFLVASLRDYALSRVRGEDPAGNISLIIGMVGSHPELITKIGNLSKFTGAYFHNFYAGTVAHIGTQSPSRAGYQEMNLSPANPENRFGTEDSTTPTYFDEVY